MESRDDPRGRDGIRSFRLPDRSSSPAQGNFADSDAIETFALFKERARSYRVLSLDVFDTALYRCGVFRPIDLFHRVGEVAEELTALSPDRFAGLRQRAERVARSAAFGRGLQETTIERIYDSFNRLRAAAGLPSVPPDGLAALVEIERAAEREILRAAPAVLELFRWAKRGGKVVVFVSDFYLDAAFVAGALDRAGYVGFDRLYVSSDVGKSKFRGDLFAFVLDDLAVSPREILHVGDSMWADSVPAAGHGIASLSVANVCAEYERRLRLLREAACNRAESAMLRHAAFVVTRCRSGTPPPDSAELARRVGAEVMGPLLLGFASWLYDRARRNRTDRLYFCSRDGLILKKAFDLYQGRFGEAAPSRYLHVSRQVVYRALAAEDEASAEDLFVQNWSVITPAQALRRWGLDADRHMVEIEAAGFADANEMLVIEDQTDDARLRRLYRACRESILSDVATARERFRGYLDQEGIGDSGRPGIVDIGWHGTAQLAVARMCPRASELHGFYVGLLIDPVAGPSFPAEGYVCGHRSDAGSPVIWSGPSVIEVLHAADHGRTTGYEHCRGGLRPVLAAPTEAGRQIAGMIGPVQEEALAFVSQCLALREFGHLRSIGSRIAAAGLARFLQRPEPDEIAAFGALRHDANYGDTAAALPLALSLGSDGKALWRAAAASGSCVSLDG